MRFISADSSDRSQTTGSKCANLGSLISTHIPLTLFRRSALFRAHRRCLQHKVPPAESHLEIDQTLPRVYPGIVGRTFGQAHRARRGAAGRRPHAQWHTSLTVKTHTGDLQIKRARRDSNARPSASETDALSN